MRTFVWFAVVLLATTAVCQVSLAGENYWVSSDGQLTSLTGQKVAGQEQSLCNSCNEAACCPEQYGSCSSCGSCDPCCCMLGCDECPSWGLVGFLGLDSFKGISDLDGQSNFGVVTGVNAGVPIPGLRDYGFGWQIGLSYGLYDFDGRVPGVVGQSTAHTQQQTFVTTGFFRKAQGDQRLSFGIVYDWMYNREWGVFGNSPTLGQWRGQVEYAMNACNGIGVWATQRDRNSVQTVDIYTVSDRALSQVNLFWHHKFASSADSWLWFGIPDHGRYDGDKSFADWMVGFNVQVPLSNRLALYGNASYLHPSAAAGPDASVEQGYDVGMGLMWYVGGYARSNSINGKCWTPYLGVANNSTFLVEQGYTP